MSNNKTIIKLPANLLRAASVFRAKKDVRGYLNGIHVNPDGFIEASDGHTGLRAECAEAKALDAPLILDIDGAIPQSADTVELVLLDDREGYLRLVKQNLKPVESNGFPVRRWVRLVQGEFPDLGAVMDKLKPEATKRVAFQTSYLVRLDKAATAMGTRYPVTEFELCGEGVPALATIRAGVYTARVAVMGCRL